MWKREIKFHPNQTPAHRAYQAKSTRRDDARKARMCDALQFWRLCFTPQCKRRHACSGDPQACFTAKWEIVPDEVKEWLRAAQTLRQSGLSPRDAMQQARAEVARVKEVEAAAARALQAAPPARVERVEPPMPRVRTL
jgi:hypothetical protein